MKYHPLKPFATATLAIIASVALSYGWYGTALFFSLWTIAGLMEIN